MPLHGIRLIEIVCPSGAKLPSTGATSPPANKSTRATSTPDIKHECVVVAMQIGQITNMADVSFLEMLHQESKDLVPHRFETVDKYLRSRGDYGVLPFSTGATANDFA
jgi:hypothetical protein